MPQAAATARPCNVSASRRDPSSAARPVGRFRATRTGTSGRRCGRQPAADVGDDRRLDQFGPRDDDHVGPPQGRERLAQQAQRQHVAETERRRCVHQDDVQVPRQPPVLEPVVQDRHAAGVVPREIVDGLPAVRVLDHGHAGAEAFHLQGFLVGAAGRAGVPAADDDGLRAQVFRKAGDEGDHGRLAGAADGEVPDADHRPRGPVDAAGQGVPEIRGGQAQAVERGQHREARPQDERKRAPAATGDDPEPRAPSVAGGPSGWTRAVHVAGRLRGTAVTPGPIVG